MLLTIDNKARQLYEVLKAMGSGWHDRGEIAAQMNKRRLNPAEVAVLDMLVRDGKAEQSSITTDRPHILKIVYRVKGE